MTDPAAPTTDPYRSTYAGGIIDAHCHFDAAAVPLVDRLVATARISGCLNLWDVAWPPTDDQTIAEMVAPFAPTVAFCHVPDLSRIGDGSSEELGAAVRRARAAGAVGVKVWKHLGLSLVDADGQLLSMLDRRLDGLWRAAAEESMPVVIHIGDPPAFFAPLDERNPRLAELRAHPEFWFGDGSFPRLDRLHADFLELVGRYPETIFVGAHFGCFLPFDVLREALAAHPNLHVDTSARVADLGGRERELAGAIVLEHRSRILFGTDFARTAVLDLPPTTGARDDQTLMHPEHYRFFETDDVVTLPFPFEQEADPPIVGLALPDEVLRAVYSENARRLFGDPWPADAP